MRVWEHLKQELERRGIKEAVSWLAKKLEYKIQRVNNWALPGRDVPKGEYGPIAAVLGTSMEWVASASGRAPKEEERVASGAESAPASEEDAHLAELVKLLRPEVREVVLAFNDLLPEDQEELGRPILERAAHMRKYLQAALSRHGVALKPGNIRGNALPVAKYEGPERRKVSSPHEPERRNALVKLSSNAKRAKNP